MFVLTALQLVNRVVCYLAERSGFTSGFRSAISTSFRVETRPLFREKTSNEFLGRL